MTETSLKYSVGNFSALDPFGHALLAYWRGDKSAQLIHEYKSGRQVSIPVSVFFRKVKDFYPTENALAYCRGHILVVGAGTGVHALELERGIRSQRWRSVIRLYR